jgi:glycosyltransferase involved in cell wall biosynthesis
MNNKKIVSVFTIYPQKGSTYDKDVGGAAHYIKNIITSLSDVQWNILAEMRGKNVNYNEREVTVKRCWRAGSLFMPLTLIRKFVFLPSRYLIVNFEFNIFGSKLNTILFLIPLFFAWISGKRIIIIQHQVIDHIKDLKDHLGLRWSDTVLHFVNIGMRFYLFLLNIFSSKIVVFEEVLKQRLMRYVGLPGEKVFVIPHPIYRAEEAKIVKKELTDSLNILFFGFITWYKGADWLAEMTVSQRWPKNYVVTFAGGVSHTAPNLAFYSNFLHTIQSSEHAKHLGYVEEEGIPDVVNSSHLFVLPYRTLISSSGPLATALGYEKPFLLSTALAEYMLTADFKEAMNKCELKKEDLFFHLDAGDFLNHLEIIVSDKDTYDKLVRFTTTLSHMRSTESISNKYRQLIHQEVQS